MSPKGHHGNIPVVDLGELNISKATTPTQDEWSRVGKQISTAFSDIGFVYLTNHGVADDVIEELQGAADNFFCKERSVKEKYNRGVQEIQGYTSPDREKLSSDATRHELRESYDVRQLNGLFPEKHVPEFKPAVSTLVQNCLKLSQHLLTALEIGLSCPPGLLTKSHAHLMSDKNATCLRVLHYPAVPSNTEAGAIRCGSHTDYGTITLLFQDNMGGLEVRDRSGKWVAADPLPGAVLVNVGDLLQMWTANKFIATEHRVLIPDAELKKRSPRRSAVFFIHPDDDVIVKPIDGSDTHTATTARAHVDRRFKETYQY